MPNVVHDIEEIFERIFEHRKCPKKETEKQKLIRLEKLVTALTDAIATQQTSINTNTQAITDAQARIAALEAGIPDETAAVAAITANTAAIDANTTTIEGLAVPPVTPNP